MLPIHELPVPGVPGLIGLSRCPGLRSAPDGSSDPAGQPGVDLERIARWGASAILTLVEFLGAESPGRRRPR